MGRIDKTLEARKLLFPIRVTAEERDTLRKMAKVMGEESVADAIRLCINPILKAITQAEAGESKLKCAMTMGQEMHQITKRFQEATTDQAVMELEPSPAI
jgi:hypothetical protein